MAFSEADPFDCVLNFTVKDFAPGGQAQGDKWGKGGLSVEMTNVGREESVVFWIRRLRGNDNGGGGCGFLVRGDISPLAALGRDDDYRKFAGFRLR